MTMTTDPLNDPRFPDRPQHPDFWKLVAAVTYLDGEAMEGGRSAQDILSQYADPESLAYLSNQRFLRAVKLLTENAPGVLDFRALVLSLYVDGFALGCQYTLDKEITP